MRRLAVSSIAVIALAAAACSPDESNFKDSAEDFIEDEDGEIATQASLTFTDAACVEPESTEEGATFLCTATGSDGQAYEFPARISGDREFEITNVLPAGTTDDSATPGTATPGTTTDTTPTS